MANHESIQHKVEQVRFKFKDWVDQPGHAAARQTLEEIERLLADVRNKKSGPTIESRLKALIRYFEELEEEVMDFYHSRELAQWCEEMRSEARSL